MRFRISLPVLVVLNTSLAWASASPARASDEAGLAAAIQSPQRSAKFVARDKTRHPLQELSFFGLPPNATVIEVWPGGGYWTEILAPYLKADGTLYVALPQGIPDEVKSTSAFRTKLAADPTLYGKVKLTSLGVASFNIAPPGSADYVLTFRNIHNWMAQGYAAKAFAAFYTALKPGGILGVEEHRGDASKPQDPKAESGYVRQDYAVQLATAAGFHLVGSSEINANPKDTKNWPQGVWTLPPAFALGAQDRAHYAAIGEADNFVLKFQK
jgi:predicted methyltransferase